MASASGPRTTKYDVLAGGSVVGCIMKLSAAPKDAQWMRTLAYRQHRDRLPSRGYEPTVRDPDSSIRQELAAGITSLGS